MLLKEKIIQERTNDNQIYLYKEGIFWKAYNRSAFHFVTLLKVYALKRKHLKNIGEDFVALGFPHSGLAEVLRLSQVAGMAATEEEKIVILTLGRSLEGYADWMDMVVSAKSDEDDSRKNAEVDTGSEELLRELRDFPIARRTPLECQFFLMELQERL